VPASIPVTAHDSAPDFRHVTRAASEANLAALRKRAGLDGEVRGIAVPDVRPGNASARPASTSIAQQEKEFQRAVQPGSPISALLTSARQPLVMSGAGGVGAKPRENLLLRKLTAAAREKHEGLENIAEEGATSAGPSKERAIRERGEEASKKQLESQKARIVAQMVPVHNEGEEQENVPPPRRERVKTKEQEKVAKLPKGKEREKERVPEREREIPHDTSPSKPSLTEAVVSFSSTSYQVLLQPILS
jgi:cell cycle serine/threonine-protein kinase CDC5/MSD2